MMSEAVLTREVKKIDDAIKNKKMQELRLKTKESLEKK